MSVHPLLSAVYQVAHTLCASDEAGAPPIGRGKSALAGEGTIYICEGHTYDRSVIPGAESQT